MSKILLRIFVVVLVLLGGLGTLVWLSLNGVIPSVEDTSDVSYEKLCGWQPSSGTVWSHGFGLGSGSAYYRLHKKRAEYLRPDAKVLTSANLPDLPHAPWWWGGDPDGKALVYSGGGLGYNTKSLEIYDPVSERLCVYCEWD